MSVESVNQSANAFSLRKGGGAIHVPRIIQRTLFALLALLFVAAVFAGAGSADGGNCGDGVEWDLTGDTLTLSYTGSGSGRMTDYTDADGNRAPWYSLRSNIKTIVTGDGVTSIGNYAFDHCSSLASITIPDGVTSIGEGAFYYCSSITSITIPDGVTSIGKDVFYECQALTSITLPDSVISIGLYGCGWQPCTMVF
ncbi:MAG TPA: leucine-rich repeat domain-containing protein, partial [Methanocorpusculum sp.]|nr:leucine-rich repeat domain-containing protein [Methanocorpusculum sp.]